MFKYRLELWPPDVSKSNIYSCKCLYSDNEGKSAARLCHQVAPWVPDMFCNFYLVKNHKITNNSATTEAGGKISSYLESWEF